MARKVRAQGRPTKPRSRSGISMASY